MKLKLAILSAFALTSANAMTPCVSVKLGAGYANSSFKAEHKFKDAVAPAAAPAAAAAAAPAASADADKKKDDKKDEDGTASEGGNGFNGVVAVDVAFAKEQFAFGLRGGAAFLGASPAIEGKVKANVPKAAAKKKLDGALAGAADDAHKATIQADFDKDHTNFEQKDVNYKISADKGMMYFVGPFGGMNINEKISADLGVALTMRKLCLTIKEGDKAEVSYEHKMNYGLMPSLTGTYKLTDMISAFVSVGYNINLSKVEAKEETSSSDDKKDDKAKAKTATPAAAASDAMITKAAAGNVLLATVGVSVKLM